MTSGKGSKLLYEAINSDYRRRTMCYLSFCNSTSQKAQDYPEKDGEWLTRYSPLGETIRKTYLEAANSIWNPWRISDKDRHTRQTPAVKCETSFAQDHRPYCPCSPAALSSQRLLAIGHVSVLTLGLIIVQFWGGLLGKAHHAGRKYEAKLKIQVPRLV